MGVSMRKARHGRLEYRHHLHRNPEALTVSIMGAVLALFVFSWIYGTNYTGYVNVDINTVHIDENAYDGTRLIISSLDGKTIPLGAARISGTIYGEGDVRVYLIANERRLLVYSNTAEPEEFSLAGEPRGYVARTELLDSSTFSFASEPERVLQLGVIEGNVQENIDRESPIYARGACRETCRLHGNADSDMYVFVFEMDPGVMFEVTNIGFS
jgi:hypothetical protein